MSEEGIPPLKITGIFQIKKKREYAHMHAYTCVLYIRRVEIVRKEEDRGRDVHF
jgi:hypothetical protein